MAGTKEIEIPNRYSVRNALLMEESESLETPMLRSSNRPTCDTRP